MYNMAPLCLVQFQWRLTCEIRLYNTVSPRYALFVYKKLKTEEFGIECLLWYGMNYYYKQKMQAFSKVGELNKHFLLQILHLH